MPDDYDYELVVYGDPRPQGRPRTRVIKPKGRDAFATIYDDPKSRLAKQNIQSMLRNQAPAQLLDCPLRVDLAFHLPRPKNHCGTGKNEGILKATSPTLHISRPDIDNLRKLVMDALTGVFWTDDSRVCEGYSTKQYSTKPATFIYIKKLKDIGAAKQPELFEPAEESMVCEWCLRKTNVRHEVGRIKVCPSCLQCHEDKKIGIT